MVKRWGQLTLYGTEAPALVLSVVVGGGAPQVAVLAADISALVEPLAVVQEGEVAGASVRVPLDRVDLWGGRRLEKPCVMQQRRAVFVLWKSYFCEPVLNRSALYVFPATCTSKHTVKTEDDVTVKTATTKHWPAEGRFHVLDKDFIRKTKLEKLCTFGLC